MCREIGRVAAFMIDLFNVFVKKSSAHTHTQHLSQVIPGTSCQASHQPLLCLGPVCIFL